MTVIRIDDLAGLLIILLLIKACAVFLLHGVNFVIIHGKLAESDKFILENAADTKLAFDVDGPFHLMNHSVANAEVQTCTSLINISVFLKPLESINSLWRPSLLIPSPLSIILIENLF